MALFPSKLSKIDRALGGSSNRITLLARGDRNISAHQAQIYEVSLPQELRSQGDDLDIRVEITLSYKAQPRRTRRSRRKYLSTWLDWDCSKKGENSERFLDRVLKEYDAAPDAEEGNKIFQWVLNKRKPWGKGHHRAKMGKLYAKTESNTEQAFRAILLWSNRSKNNGYESNFNEESLFQAIENDKCVQFSHFGTVMPIKLVFLE